MRLFFSLALISLCFAFSAQETITYPYNPDGDADGAIFLNDLLDILSLYGNEFEVEPINIIDESCIPEIVQSSMSSSNYDSYLSYFSSAYQDIQATFPNWIDYCTLASWQHLIYSDPLLDFYHVYQDLDYYYNNWSIAYNLTLPSNFCFFLLENDLNISNAVACESWGVTNALSGVDTYQSHQVTDGFGGLIIRGSGSGVTRFICVPPSYSHVFFRGSGIDCTYNITHNPNTTTIVGLPSGINPTLNLIEETDLDCPY